MIRTIDLLLAAAGLMSDGENSEYDRACVELTADLMGIPEQERDALEHVLRSLR